MVKVIASHESIKKQVLDNIKTPFDAFNEFIWNALDAEAKNVSITIKTGADHIKSLEIEDDGQGIDYDDLNKDLFRKFNTSNKFVEKNSSLPRGNKGFGRFSFIHFCSRVVWKTVFRDIKDRKNYEYDIEIEDYKLDDFQPKNKRESSKNSGTKVSFIFSTSNNKNLITPKNKDILYQLKQNIFLEFAWIIELLNLNITINGKKLDYSHLIDKQIEHDKKINSYKFKFKFIKWHQALKNQSSRYYYLNKKGEEVFVDTTTLNQKMDEYYHSIFVTSEYFDDFNLLKTRYEPTYKELMKYVDKYLREQRRPFIKNFSKNKYEEFKKKDILPKFSAIEKKIKQPIYEEVVREIIEFAPGLVSNTNECQRRILLELINQLLDDESSRKTLYRILEILIDEDNKDQLCELQDKLEKYGLKNLLGMIKLVDDRIETIERLKILTSDAKKYVSESELQRIIEEHFWIFGEEYNLMIGSEEDDFSKLRKLYYEKVKKMKPKEIADLFISKKQVDLFICGVMSEGRKTRNMIVEIKRPKEYLKKKHYMQIDDYKDIIMKVPEFNTPERNHWDFVLLYTDISKEHTTFFESEIKDKFTGLAKDNHINFRIFVRKWADLLDEVNFRLKFLRDSLNQRKKKIADKKK
ncbi:MAG: ATP-binding protein [Nanoarchaeota archaeon]|nr:ATP-binding protein [Nanoarchaeota archaeon]